MAKDSGGKSSDREAGLSREERLAAELRANLRKRKSAARARSAPQSEKTSAPDGHPGDEETRK